MKRYFSVFVFCSLLFSGLSANAQTDYGFINEVIKPKTKLGIKISDTIYIQDKFIKVGKEIFNPKYINEKSFHFWWKQNLIQTPIELFLNNFNLDHLKYDVSNLDNNEELDFTKLNTYFKKSTKAFSKRTFLRISQTVFNCNKTWCILFSEEFTPYIDLSSGLQMYIYTLSNEKWILYAQLTLSS